MNTRYTFDRAETLSVGASQQFAISRFITRTYSWMFVGLLLTAFVSYFLASSERSPALFFRIAEFLCWRFLQSLG